MQKLLTQCLAHGRYGINIGSVFAYGYIEYLEATRHSVRSYGQRRTRQNLCSQETQGHLEKQMMTYFWKIHGKMTITRKYILSAK